MMRSRLSPISSARAADKSADRDHRLARDGAGLERLRARRVLVHERGQKILIERTPVGADAHRLAVADGDLDDLAELQVALVLEADIAGIDAIFVERFGAGRMIGEQLMADVMEVADQRRRDPSGAQAVADMGHGGGGLVAIDRDAHQLRACPRQSRDLARGRLDVGGVGVGHRLHDDRRAAANGNRPVAVADPNPDGRVAGKRPAGRFRHRKAHRHHTFPAALRPKQSRRVLSPRREFVIRDVCSATNPSKASPQCNMTALTRTVSPRGPMRRNADVARQTPRPRHRLDKRHRPGDRPRPRQGGGGRRHQRVWRQGGDRGGARQNREGVRGQGFLP